MKYLLQQRLLEMYIIRQINWSCMCCRRGTVPLALPKHNTAKKVMDLKVELTQRIGQVMWKCHLAKE